MLLLFLVLALAQVLRSQVLQNMPDMQARIAQELDVQAVSVFDVRDAGNYRFAGYTADGQYGFAVFERVKNGGYLFRHAKPADRMISRAKDISYDYHGGYWIIVSRNASLSTIQAEIRYESGAPSETVARRVTKNPSITVVETPSTNYSAEYSFIDKDGNAIS